MSTAAAADTVRIAVARMNFISSLFHFPPLPLKSACDLRILNFIFRYSLEPCIGDLHVRL